MKAILIKNLCFTYTSHLLSGNYYVNMGKVEKNLYSSYFEINSGELIDVDAKSSFTYEIIYNGIQFYFTNPRILDGYFISLSEYRTKQIESILKILLLHRGYW